MASDFDINSWLVGYSLGLLGKTIPIKKDKIETNDEIVHNGIIPEGGTYYVGVTSTSIGNYTGATATYVSGEAFPTTVSDGDCYVFGDYEYRYNRYWYRSLFAFSWTSDTTLNGWGVRVLDSTKTSFGSIVSTINNQNVVTLYATFNNCSNLTDASGVTIPRYVRSMRIAFSGCKALVSAPIIRRDISVIDFTSAFYNCTALIDISRVQIPYSAVDMTSMFSNCQSLTDASMLSIPASVENFTSAFNYCVTLVTPPDMRNATGLTTLKSAFTCCKVLTTPPDISNAVNVTTIESIFDGCVALQHAPDISKMKKLTSVYSAFYNCTALTKAVAIPDNVISANYVFSGCSNITDISMVNIPSAATGINAMFRSCSSIVDASHITIPSSVYDIQQLFSGCTSLKYPPAIPDTVTNMYSVFYGCSAIDNLDWFTMPSGAIHIGNMFTDCTGIGDVTGLVIPASCNWVRGTFEGCTNLTGTIHVETESLTNDNAALECFLDTVKPITLTGTGTAANASILSRMAATATNGNVTVATS